MQNGRAVFGTKREGLTQNIYFPNFLTEKSITVFLISLCLIVMSADNLAANFSRELADYIIYIIDVSGGDKIPRKGGPGITQADLLVCGLLHCSFKHPLKRNNDRNI